MEHYKNKQMKINNILINFGDNFVTVVTIFTICIEEYEEHRKGPNPWAASTTTKKM